MNIKYIIREALGVHEDVKTLAEFLNKYFQGDTESVADLRRKWARKEITYDEYQSKADTIHSGKHVPKGVKTFTSDELPPLKDLKIDKLIVEYKPRNMFTRSKAAAHFNTGKSYTTDKGIVAYLKFMANPNIETVYHELTHVLQFYKLGSKKMTDRLKPTRTTGISSTMVKGMASEKEYEILETFTHLVYQSSDAEITAKTTETYAEMKSFLAHSDIPETEKYRYHYNNSTFSQNSIVHRLKATYGYTMAEMMIDYDIFKEFQKLDSDLVIKFFSYVKDYEKFIRYHSSGWDRMWEIVKSVVKLMKQSYTQKVELLSEDEVIKMMKHYNERINSQGEKLYRKIGKLYAHFV